MGFFDKIDNCVIVDAFDQLRKNGPWNFFRNISHVGIHSTNMRCTVYESHKEPAYYIPAFCDWGSTNCMTTIC